MDTSRRCCQQLCQQEKRNEKLINPEMNKSIEPQDVVMIHLIKISYDLTELGMFLSTFVFLNCRVMNQVSMNQGLKESTVAKNMLYFMQHPKIWQGQEQDD